MTVFQKQCILAYLGYYEGQIDGQWGPLTEKATEAFQADYGLAVDGVYGDGTHARAAEIIASKELTVIQQRKADASTPDINTSTHPPNPSASTDWPDCPNFTRAEFACHCGCGFDDVAHELVKNCQTVRDHFGAAFIPSSGCRCKAHNARVGGVYNSRHLLGRAVDFRIQGRRAAEVDAFVATLPGIVYHYCIDADYVHMDIGGVIAMENIWVTLIQSGFTFLGIWVTVYFTNKKANKQLSQKVDKLVDHDREQYLSLLRLTVMNEAMPISERIIAGDKYVKAGGNGDVKKYYQNMLREHTK